MFPRIGTVGGPGGYPLGRRPISRNLAKHSATASQTSIYVWAMSMSPGVGESRNSASNDSALVPHGRTWRGIYGYESGTLPIAVAEQ